MTNSSSCYCAHDTLVRLLAKLASGLSSRCDVSTRYLNINITHYNTPLHVPSGSRKTFIIVGAAVLIPLRTVFLASMPATFHVDRCGTLRQPRIGTGPLGPEGSSNRTSTAGTCDNPKLIMYFFFRHQTFAWIFLYLS